MELKDEREVEVTREKLRSLEARIKQSVKLRGRMPTSRSSPCDRSGE